MIPATLALIGRDRLAGACGLTWLALVLYSLPHASSRIAMLELTALLLPCVCYVVMVTAPRTRPRELRRAVCITAVAAAAALWAFALGHGTLTHAGDVERAALAALSLLGLLRWPSNPVLAIASAILWTAIGFACVDPLVQAHVHPILVLELAAAPLVVLASRLRLRAASTPGGI